MMESRKVLKRFLHKGYYPPLDLKVSYEILGSVYGGWAILPSLLDTNSIVYSFGIGDDISFDVALIEKFGVEVFAFDPTPKSISWVAQQALPGNFTFVPIGLAHWDGDAVFLPPPNPNFVSYKMANPHHQLDNSSLYLDKYPVKRLGTLMNKLGHASIDVLKMDIEGAEYDVIGDMLSCNIYPKVLLVEFHHRWQEIGIQKTKKNIQMLREKGYKLFYVSDRDEFGFLYTKEQK